MEGTQNYIIECARINSLGAKKNSEKGNESSWTNKISPVLFKTGDALNLSNVLINIPGANSDAIYFQGSETEPGTNIQDNFTLMKIGFHINHNGINTSALPIRYLTTTAGGQGDASLTTILTDTDKTLDDLSNNKYGSFYDFQYFKGDGSFGYDNAGTKILDDWQKISNIKLDSIMSCNPNFIMDGRKFAKISPGYTGWWRDNSDTAYKGRGIEPMLFTQDIPMLLNKGFTNPSAIAAQVTILMNQTNKLYSEDTYLPEANSYKTDSGKDDLRRVKLYNFNGYSYKTVTCNLQTTLDSQHHIYGNIAVDEPLLWKYGINIISNAEVDNMKGSQWIKPTLTNAENLTIDYPTIIWQRFIGDDPSNFDIGDNAQYVLYSPWKTDVVDSGTSSVLTISGFSKGYIPFNANYVSAITDNGDGAMLYPTSDESYKIVRNSSLGSNLDNNTLFYNNSHTSETDLVGYSRFIGVSGAWYASEQQIFVSIPDIQDNAYSPASAFISFTILSGIPALEIKCTGIETNEKNYKGGLLTAESGGIIEGASYIITFNLQHVDPNEKDNLETDFTATPILVKGNGIGPLDTEGNNVIEFTTNGSKSISFTATGTNVTSNSIQFGMDCDGHTITYVHVTNISIIRTNIGNDEPYIISNMWTSNYNNPDNNKIYFIQQVNGDESIEVSIADLVQPVQPIMYPNTNFNHTYTTVEKGLVFRFVGNEIVVTDNIGSRDDSVAILYYQDDGNNYTYWMYQREDDLSSWFLIRTTLYSGAVLRDGSTIGDTKSDEVLLKNQFRTGQQYYDLENVDDWQMTTNYVNLDTGLTWESNIFGQNDLYVIDNYVGLLRSFEYNTNMLFYYDWKITPIDVETGISEDFEIYLQITNDDGTQGNYRSENTEDYGTWILNGAQISFTATEGDDFLFTTADNVDTNDKISITIDIKNEDFNNPGGLPWNTSRYYFWSYTAYRGSGNYIKYYVSLLPDEQTTNVSLSGTTGTTYTTDSEGTWVLDLNTKIFTNGIAADSITLVTESNINLSDIVLYETSTNKNISGNIFNVPIDGHMYGGEFPHYGTSTIENDYTPTMYLGFNAANDANGLLNVTTGHCYDKIDDAFASNNGKKWQLARSDTKYQFKIYRESDGVELLLLSAPDTQIRYSGWIICKTQKITVGELTINDTSIKSVKNTAWIATGSEDINNNLESLMTNGETGIHWQMLSNANGGSVVDRGLFQNFQDRDVENFKAYIANHQILLTNIKYTQSNIEMFEKFFRYNEVYDGDKEIRTDISNDTDNFYIQMDLGRGSDIPDVSHDSDVTNTTGQTPLQPYYMYDSGIMGNNSNLGAMSPMKKLNDQEQRIRVHTGWKDNYENRLITSGTLDYEYCYADSITTTEFKRDYSDLYNYVKTNNIGCFPVKAKDGTLRIAFETYQDYTGDQLFKIQNFTYFVYSPMTVDHDYVTLWNSDYPARKDNDYSYTADYKDYCNFINIGATKPAFDYNESLGKFSWKYWYVPSMFNKVTGADSNLGEEAARLYDNANNIIFRDFPAGYSKMADDNRRHIGINDSQSGIYLMDAYFKNIDDKMMSSSTDSRAIMMTTDNFYNSIWYRLGFTYYGLKPIKFTTKSFHDNRFSNKSYNSTILSRDEGIVPFAMNSNISIQNMPGLNVYSQNSGTKDTENPNVGTPIYGLGYNNALTVAAETESDVMYSQNLPINITSGFFRIYTDLPTDTLQYTADQNLNCIGIGLLNYASSGQFFFSYQMDYGVSITRDVLINNIHIEIRDERGQQVQGLGERSTVVLKLSRNISIGPPKEDPELEALTKIEMDLEDGHESSDNKVNDADPMGSKSDNRLYDNLVSEFLKQIVEQTHVSRGDTQNDIINDVYRNLHSALNSNVFSEIRDKITNKDYAGINDMLNTQYHTDINLNGNGQIIKGNVPRYNDLHVSDNMGFEIYKNRNNFSKELVDKLISTDKHVQMSKYRKGTYNATLTSAERQFINKRIMPSARPYVSLFETTRQEQDELDSKTSTYLKRMKDSYKEGNIREFKSNLSKYLYRVSDVLGAKGSINKENASMMKKIVGKINDKDIYNPRKTKIEKQNRSQMEQADRESKHDNVKFKEDHAKEQANEVHGEALEQKE